MDPNAALTRSATMPAVRARTLATLSTPLPLLILLACQPDAQPHADQAGSVAAGRAPAASPTPAPTPEPDPEPDATANPDDEPEPEPDPEPAPIVDPDPVMAERKQALADVGRSAFDALQAGDFAELLELTPVQPGPLKDACGRMPLSAKHELEARFDHCHDAIAWDRVAEAQAFAGKPTGAAANGCEAEIEDYGRLQVFVHLDDATIWRVEFFGAVGRDGKVVGLNGEVACKIVPEAPKL